MVAPCLWLPGGTGGSRSLADPQLQLLVDQLLLIAATQMVGQLLQRLQVGVQLLAAAGGEQFVELAPGEKTKQLTEVEKVTDQMLRCEFTRRDVVIGVGGGVVGDVAGLIASLFMRGVGLVHVPTTVVAQVDSAIGGKTGVNLEGGKNILGTFYPAHRIVSDLDFLSTLPDRDFNAGFAEVVKYGAIASEDFFSWLESHVEQVVNRESGF